MAQDERRALFEEQSHHIAIGLEYLPAIARRLHHSRELGEPFDFLTWFEYAPEDGGAFEKLVQRLRATPEWRYVDAPTRFRYIDRIGYQMRRTRIVDRQRQRVTGFGTKVLPTLADAAIERKPAVLLLWQGISFDINPIRSSRRHMARQTIHFF